MEEGDVVYETVVVKSLQAQLCDSLISLSQNVDVCRDMEARAFLLQAMSAVVYELNPPKGELRDIKKSK